MAPEWRQLGDVPILAGARAAVAHDGAIFVAGAGGRLWRVDPQSLEAPPFGDPTIRARHIAATAGRLFVIAEGGGLFVLDTADGSHRALDGEWSDVRAVCGRAGLLQVIAGGIVEVDPEDAGWRPIGEREWTPQLFLSDEESLFVLEENGGLFRIDGEGGEHRQLDGEWGDVAAGTARSRGLYLATDEGALYALDGDGSYVQLPCGAPAGARMLLVSGSVLYAALADGALHAVTLD